MDQTFISLFAKQKRKALDIAWIPKLVDNDASGAETSGMFQEVIIYSFLCKINRATFLNLFTFDENKIYLNLGFQNTEGH